MKGSLQDKMKTMGKSKIMLAAAVALVAAAGFLFTSVQPVASQDKEVSAWTVRCDKDGAEGQKGHCEIFQRLIVKETGQRFAEFAITVPQNDKANDKANEEDAKGVVILPLGILLPGGAQMSIADQKFRFQIRYCTQQGCFAFLDMNSKLLDMMRKGEKAVLTFNAVSGKSMNVDISLAGFTKSLEEIS